MAKQRADCFDIRTPLYEPGSEGVSEVVEAESLDFSPFTRRNKTPAKRGELVARLGIDENVRGTVRTVFQASQLR